MPTELVISTGTPSRLAHSSCLAFASETGTASGAPDSARGVVPSGRTRNSLFVAPGDRHLIPVEGDRFTVLDGVQLISARSQTGLSSGGAGDDRFAVAPDRDLHIRIVGLHDQDPVLSEGAGHCLTDLRDPRRLGQAQAKRHQ